MAVLDTRPPAAPARPDRRDARVAGLAYLGLGVSGMLGFLLIRPQLFDSDDPATTLANLLQHETLARWGIALELAVVLTQVLAALWFFRMFRRVDAFAAGAIAVFGVVNAVAILASAAFLAAALDVALEPVGAGGSQLMYVVSDHFWGVGNMFFGLWLIPMGWCVLRSRWVSRVLGWILVVGGVGYLLSAFARYLLPDAEMLVALLPLAATVGELWMIGWLLVTGWRRPVPATAAG